MSVEKLVEHFSALEDPRCAGKAGQSGEAYKVLSQDRRRAVGYVCPSICTFVEE